MKKGFTLAEILVTVAIIGVVAAITIPSITTKRVNQNKLLFRKAFKLTENIALELANDETKYPYDKDRFGLKNTDSVIIAGRTYQGNSKFRDLFKEKLDIIEDNGQNFTTKDGIRWTISNSNFNNPLNILIDVNGPDNGDNCRCTNTTCNSCKNPDQFLIIIRNTGIVSVTGTKETEYIDIKDVMKKTTEFGY